ncbi:MAG TPA: hypothetical protein VKA60_16160 [Blastocatellia bacterium]|nr:hypothetical protein [Blastocatellia bacterium]
MTVASLADLQASVQDKTAFHRLEDYLIIGRRFLEFIEQAQPTRIISPSHPHYIFYQFSEAHAHRITRPLNSHLLIHSVTDFTAAFGRFVSFLAQLRRHQQNAADKRAHKKFIASKGINKVIYTIQQSIGSIGDSFDNVNQARKRAGQLFENLVKLIIQEAGLECEPRTINLPIPGYPGYRMPYELDLVFSRDKVIVASETRMIDTAEIVGSVKTTSKDRIDKIFLDKHLLTKLLGRDIPVAAIFLHDVQRAQKGNSIFGIASTFKSNHFLGYTVALNKLDGVYYVDPRPEMAANERLREQIHDFQQFLLTDLWVLSSR